MDNSDDDIIRYQDTKKIKYIKLHENKGIAYALNKGAKEAIAQGFDWLLTLDQDSQITKEIIEHIEYAKEKGCFLMGTQDPELASICVVKGES